MAKNDRLSLMALLLSVLSCEPVRASYLWPTAVWTRSCKVPGVMPGAAATPMESYCPMRLVSDCAVARSNSTTEAPPMFPAVPNLATPTRRNRFTPLNVWIRTESPTFR